MVTFNYEEIIKEIINFIIATSYIITVSVLKAFCPYSPRALYSPACPCVISLAVPLLDQPLEITGSRKRKEVQRFVPKTPDEVNKEVKIPEGKGKALGSIETIEFNIQVNAKWPCPRKSKY